jgi:hypothetical protein
MGKEYHLDTSGAPDLARSLDAFTLGYIESAMWTLTLSWYECDDCGTKGYDWHGGVCPECHGDIHEHTEDCDDLGLDALTPEVLARAIADCKTFQERYREDLDEASDEQKDRTDAHHGHDFWLTRNGHGCGFWDRGYDEDLSERLTRAAKSFGSDDWMADLDGKVY